MPDPAAVPQRAILSTEEVRRMLSTLHERGVTQWPFELVAADLVANGLAFYPDETSENTTRTVALLRKLVRDGTLPGIAPVRGDAGTCHVTEARHIAERLREARQTVEGRGILATAAADKYGFDVNSIYRWNAKQWVRIVDIQAGDRLFNEGDIAFARSLADLIGHKPGKAVFPYRTPTGRPPKNR